MNVALPLSLETRQKLTVGQKVYLSGVVYTARDAAHARLCEALAQNQSTPLELSNATIFYVGPTPPRANGLPGAAGPTTSSRMDAYTIPLLNAGVSCLIGKGERNFEVTEAIKNHQAIYFTAVGGAGALIAKCIKSMELVAWPELGPEAIYKLEVKDLPLYVAS